MERTRWCCEGNNDYRSSALSKGEWSASRPGRFTPEKGPRHPLNRRLFESQGRCGCYGYETTSCSCRDWIFG